MILVVKSLNEEFYKTLSKESYISAKAILNKPIELYRFDKLKNTTTEYVDLIIFDAEVYELRCFYDEYIIINKENNPEYYL